MCAIVDANAIAEVFGNVPPSANTAGYKFFQWLNDGKGKLVIGGKLRHEITLESFHKWASEAKRKGILRDIPDYKVDAQTHEVEHNANLQSNDPHIIALAQVSGARLLYSNDEALHQDFKCLRLISHPRGRIYSTRQGSDFKDSHKQLLANKNLCRWPANS